MADLKNNENLAMDLKNLISCIECHKEEENIEVTLETMKTIVNICAEEEVGKDFFRDVGGLDFLLQYIIDTDQILILECSLKTLAFVIDKNVHSQMHLTQDKVFQILFAIIQKKSYPLGVLKNAIILFSTLLYQNRGAQDLIDEYDCLVSLMNLYKCFSPVSAHHNNSFEDSEHLELWLHINSALCFAVNNPFHEKNQSVCSDLFPFSIRIIEVSSSPVIIKAASSFLSLCVADNEKNQSLFAEKDGFFMLKRSLSRNFEEIQLCIRDCNNVIKKDNLDILNALISIVSAAVLDHEKNAFLCGKLGIVSVMTKLLADVPLNSSSTKKILLVLGNCVDAYRENKCIILEIQKLDILLKRNLKTNDSELYSATRYLLQVCLNDFMEEKEEIETFRSQNYGDSIESCPHKCKCHDETGIPQQNSPNQSNKFVDLTKTFDQQKSLSFKDIPEFGSIDFQTKCKQSNAQQNHYSCKCTKDTNFEKDSGTESDLSSLGDASLQSAAHLFRLGQMKMEHKSSRKKGKSKNCHTVRQLRCTNAESEANNFGIQSIDMDSLISEEIASKNTQQKYCFDSRPSDSLKQMHEARKINIQNSSPRSQLPANNKQGLSDETEVSFDENKRLSNEIALSLEKYLQMNLDLDKFRGTGKKGNNFGIQRIKMDCQKTKATDPKMTLQKCHCDSRNSDALVEDTKLLSEENKKHEVKRRNKQISSHAPELSANRKQMPNAEIDASYDKNKCLSDEKALSLSKDARVKSNLNKCKGTGKKRQTTKPYCSDLHDSSTHRQNVKKSHPSAAGSSRQLHSPNTAGCMEVIVLPGAGCPEHQLSAQFELLKVCPLKKR